MRIICIGGGTGLATQLHGWVMHLPDVYPTAIVATTDTGGSTGDLRKQFQKPAAGDARRCVDALSSLSEDDPLRLAWSYRYGNGENDEAGLSGHVCGNLMIQSLMQQFPEQPSRAVEEWGKILKINGEVLLVSDAHATLVFTLSDGSERYGEDTVPLEAAAEQLEITDVQLTNPDHACTKQVLAALNHADLCVLGPGSFWTSVVPPLLFGGMREAIERLQERGVPLVYALNVSTERGETERWTAEKHVERLINITGCKPDYALVNTNVQRTDPDENLEGNVHHITAHVEHIGSVQVVREDLVSLEKPLLHDPKKLTNALRALLNEHPFAKQKNLIAT